MTVQNSSYTVAIPGNRQYIAVYQKANRGVVFRPPKIDYLHFAKVNGFLPFRAYEAGGYSVDYTPGVLVVTTRAHSGGPYYKTLSTRTDTYSGNFCAGEDPGYSWTAYTSSWTSSIWNSVIAGSNAAALERVKAVHAGLAESLVEAGKARSMIVHTVLRLVRAARHVRRFQFRAAARVLDMSGVPPGVSRRKSFSSNWLAYRYGWMPLYLDVYGVMKVAHDAATRPIVKVCTGRAQQIYNETRSRPRDINQQWDNIVNPGSWYNLGCRDTTDRETTYRCQMQYAVEFTNPNVATLTQLGLADPIGLAKELIPLSFVADWFVNVGDVLSQLTAFNGKKFLSRCQTRYYTQTKRSKQAAYTSETTYPAKKSSTLLSISFQTDPAYNRSDWLVKREVFGEPLNVQLAFANGLNVRRILDAAALLRQALR